MGCFRGLMGDGSMVEKPVKCKHLPICIWLFACFPAAPPFSVNPKAVLSNKGNKAPK